MITVLRGPAGAGKTTRLYGILLEKAKEQKTRDFILSVPEQFTLSAMRHIMEMSEEKGILNIDVLSFNRLSHRIFESSGDGKARILDDTAKNLLIRLIASEKKDSLKIFGNNMNRQGYVSSVKSVISEFMQYGYGLFDIDDMIAKIRDTEPALACKLSDIRIIYEEFQKKLGKEYMTREELLVRAARDAKKAPFLKGTAVFLDGFTGFTPVQYEFIRSIYEITGEMYVTVTDDGSGDPLFELGRSTIDHLEQVSDGDLTVMDVNEGKIVRHADPGVFGFIGKNIFRRTGKTVDNDGSVSFCAAKSMEEEVGFVLSGIRSLVSDRGYRYRDIAVIMGDTGQYADILKKEALRLDVPVYVDATRGIEFNPFSQMLKAAVNCVREDMSYESVFNFLRTQMTGLDTDDIDMAENYIRAFKIRGMNRYAKEFSESYAGISEEMKEAANRVRVRAEGLLRPLYDIRRSATAHDYTGKLYELTVNMSSAAYLEKRAAEFEIQGDMVRKMEFEQIYREIMDLFDSIVSTIGDSVMDIEEYYGILEAGLSEIKVGTLPPAKDCVSAGDLERSRFGDIKALFFIGLSENNVPAPPSKGGIISDMDRQLLKDNDFELAPTAVEKAAVGKFYYYMNILKPSEKLCLSYSSTSGDGSSRKMSYFMKETMRLFNEAEIREYDDRKDSVILCRSDALKTFADLIGCDESAVPLYRALSPDPAADRIVDAHFTVWADRLSKDAAKVLFGGTKQESPSQLERFAACAYAHYLQYGLRLKERIDFEFASDNIGTLLHDILKRYSVELENEKLTFVNVTDEESETVLKKVLSEAGEEKIERLYESSARNAYMKKRIERIAGRTVDTLRYQARSGDFLPSAFEKDFHFNGLKGYIDRVDRYEDGQDVYISIIDYKSGDRKFDRDRIYYGLDLQLLIYMSAAMDMEISLNGRDGSTVHPAGLFYYHIDDPIVDEKPGISEEDVEEKIRAELRLSGVVNSDEKIIHAYDRGITANRSSCVIPVRADKNGEIRDNKIVLDENDMKKMIDRTLSLVTDFRESIKDGVISRAPYYFTNGNACQYCRYLSICDRGKMRRLKKGAWNTPENNSMS
ncbi:MAG: PD-(D/E)XK nuclease family protein [Lachnospiraceae bacterium]|nr:PD-(D/E)XK nuclease family protein [Lachnospiraceae bacterium]